MNEIACGTILDLIPLVKDKVASKASEELVKKHIEDCKSCKEVYNSFNGENVDLEEPVIDEKRVIDNMKRKVLMSGALLIVISALVGLVLSDTMGMFYNILIMPFIGVVGYLILEKRSYLLPISIFLFSYIWLFIKYFTEAIETGEYIGFLISTPISLGLVYFVLTAIGILIAFLLKYAFGRVKTNEI